MQTERKAKFYLSFSEVPPIFDRRSKIVKGERKAKFYVCFSEVPPIFDRRSKIVKGEQKAKQITEYLF